MEQHASLSSHLGVRERWLTTTLLGLGLITFAIDASNTQLILPQMMTSLRVEVYRSIGSSLLPGLPARWSLLPPDGSSAALGRVSCTCSVSAG